MQISDLYPNNLIGCGGGALTNQKADWCMEGYVEGSVQRDVQMVVWRGTWGTARSAA